MATPSSQHVKVKLEQPDNHDDNVHSDDDDNEAGAPLRHARARRTLLQDDDDDNEAGAPLRHARDDDNGGDDDELLMQMLCNDKVQIVTRCTCALLTPPSKKQKKADGAALRNDDDAHKQKHKCTCGFMDPLAAEFSSIITTTTYASSSPKKAKPKKAKQTLVIDLTEDGDVDDDNAEPAQSAPAKEDKKEKKRKKEDKKEKKRKKPEHTPVDQNGKEDKSEDKSEEDKSEDKDSAEAKRQKAVAWVLGHLPPTSRPPVVDDNKEKVPTEKRGDDKKESSKGKPVVDEDKDSAEAKAPAKLPPKAVVDDNKEKVPTEKKGDDNKESSKGKPVVDDNKKKKKEKKMMKDDDNKEKKEVSKDKEERRKRKRKEEREKERRERRERKKPLKFRKWGLSVKVQNEKGQEEEHDPPEDGDDPEFEFSKQQLETIKEEEEREACVCDFCCFGDQKEPGAPSACICEGDSDCECVECTYINDDVFDMMNSTTTSEGETLHEKFERKVVQIFDSVVFRVPRNAKKKQTKEERERLTERARNRAREEVYNEKIEKSKNLSDAMARLMFNEFAHNNEMLMYPTIVAINKWLKMDVEEKVLDSKIDEDKVYRIGDNDREQEEGEAARASKEVITPGSRFERPVFHDEGEECILCSTIKKLRQIAKSAMDVDGKYGGVKTYNKIEKARDMARDLWRHFFEDGNEENLIALKTHPLHRKMEQRGRACRKFTDLVENDKKLHIFLKKIMPTNTYAYPIAEQEDTVSFKPTDLPNTIYEERSSDEEGREDRVDDSGEEEEQEDEEQEDEEEQQKQQQQVGNSQGGGEGGE